MKDSIRSSIGYNLIDNLPFDLRDGSTTPLSRATSTSVTLNDWCRVEVTRQGKVKLNLRGHTPSGSKSVRNYKLSAKGALPDGFWEAIREHTDRNVQLERERERHSKNISSTWPQFEDYIKVTGYDGDDWAKDQIQTGNRSNLTIKDDSHETEVTLSLDDKRRVYVVRLSLENKYIPSDKLKEILDLINQHNTPPPPPPEVVLASANKSLFDGVWNEQ